MYAQSGEIPSDFDTASERRKSAAAPAVIQFNKRGQMDKGKSRAIMDGMYSLRAEQIVAGDSDTNNNRFPSL